MGKPEDLIEEMSPRELKAHQKRMRRFFRDPKLSSNYAKENAGRVIAGLERTTWKRTVRLTRAESEAAMRKLMREMGLGGFVQ